MSAPETLEKQALQLPTIDPRVRIGHVHLKVADLQRALDFYCGVLGFTMTTSRPGAAFISAGGYHHHLGLNTWESRGGSPPAPGTTGLYHTAILYPTRRLLADALKPADRRQDPARRRQRPRRLRGALSARPGRQRRRALLGPAEGEVAAEAGRLAADVHPPARPARSVGGAGALRRLKRQSCACRVSLLMTTGLSNHAISGSDNASLRMPSFHGPW